jgi:hypothetical protein
MHCAVRVASLNATAAAPADGFRAALVSGPDGHRFLAEERAVTGLGRSRGVLPDVAH